MVVESWGPKSTSCEGRLSHSHPHYNLDRICQRNRPVSPASPAWDVRCPTSKREPRGARRRSKPAARCSPVSPRISPRSPAPWPSASISHQRDELLEADPQTSYVKGHYLNYPCVLVRLARIPDDALRDLLRMGYEFVRRRNARSPANHLRQGYGGPPKLHAKAEAARPVPRSRKAGSRKLRSPKQSGGS